MTVESVKQSGRYDAPEGWSFDFFKTRSHNPVNAKVKKLYNIRYGVQFNADAQVNILVLPGNTESIDKYFEVIGRMGEKVKANFWGMDWMGQGGSDRYLADEPRKMHSVDYARDIKDLGRMVHKIRVNNKHPIVLFTHSRGGHLSVRYLAETGKNTPVSALVTTAPMLDIVIRGFDKKIEQAKAVAENVKKKKRKKSKLTLLSDSLGKKFLTSTERLSMFLGTAKALGLIKPSGYIPGRYSWKKDFLFNPFNASSTCKERLQDFHAHEAKPENENIRMSDITYGWLMATAKSVKWLKDNNAYSKVRVPVLMFRAGADTIVRKSAQKAAAQQIKDCKSVKFENARHDLWMEQNSVFDTMIKLTKEFIEEKVLLVQNTAVKSTPSGKKSNDRTAEVCTPK